MRLRIARATALTSYLGLIGLVMAWVMFLGQVEERHISMLLLLFVTPLLIPLRGVLAGRDKALIWGALISLLYLVHGGMEIWAAADNVVLGWFEAMLSVAYLVSASLFIRWRAQEAATA